jgi:ribonuclease P protein component
MPAVIIKSGTSNSSQKPLIVVGKGVSKKATERNLLKRRVRAVLRAHTGKNNPNPVIILRKEALKMSFKDLQKEIISKI